MQILSTTYSCQPIKKPRFGINNQAVTYKDLGNDFLSQSNYSSAIESYKKAIVADSNYPDAYYNLAKAYILIKDYQNAKTANEKLVSLVPNNVEYRVNLANCYLKTGDLKNAKIQIEQGLLLDKNYDPVNRVLKRLEIENMKRFSPALAQTRIKQQERENLSKALNFVKEYYPKNVIDEISDVKIMFDNTEELQGYSNIAQYENYNNRIVVSNDYLWAAPEVVAAYIVHEVIHAKDKDPYTSVKEEQDAYKESIKYWALNNKGIKDPELDYALDLYNKSPELLAQRVKQIYKTRDNKIQDFSPNHGLEACGLKYFLYKLRDLFCETYFMNSKSRKLAVIA